MRVFKKLYEVGVFVLFYFAGLGFLQALTLSTWYWWIREAISIKEPTKLKEGFTLDTIHSAQLPGLWIALIIAVAFYAARYYSKNNRAHEFTQTKIVDGKEVIEKSYSQED